MYISIDGNSTGKFIEKLIFDNELSLLSEFSNKLLSVVNQLTGYITQMGGKVIMSGGDNVLAELPDSVINTVLQHMKSVSIDDYKFSMAISNTAQGAYIGLKYAKATGRLLVRADVDLNGTFQFSFIQ